MSVPNDITIAQSATMQPISAIASKLGLSNEQIEPYGHYKAKIDPAALFARPAKSNRSKLYGGRTDPFNVVFLLTSFG